MTEQEDSLARMIAVLKEPVTLDPAITTRVMAELKGRAAPASGGPAPQGAWWRRRWTIRLGPLGAFAVAGGLAAIIFTSQRAGRRAGVESVGRAAAVAHLSGQTQFVLVAKDARAVALVGDFNDWSLSATPLARSDSNGVWWVTVPLVPGRYRYAYVVDGTVWRPDPAAPAAQDEFGRPNSVLTIGGA